MVVGKKEYGFFSFPPWRNADGLRLKVAEIDRSEVAQAATGLLQASAYLAYLAYWKCGCCIWGIAVHPLQLCCSVHNFQGFFFICRTWRIPRMGMQQDVVACIGIVKVYDNHSGRVDSKISKSEFPDPHQYINIYLPANASPMTI